MFLFLPEHSCFIFQLFSVFQEFSLEIASSSVLMFPSAQDILEKETANPGDLGSLLSLMVL